MDPGSFRFYALLSIRAREIHRKATTIWYFHIPSEGIWLIYAELIQRRINSQRSLQNSG